MFINTKYHCTLPINNMLKQTTKTWEVVQYLQNNMIVWKKVIREVLRPFWQIFTLFTITIETSIFETELFKIYFIPLLINLNFKNRDRTA